MRIELIYVILIYCGVAYAAHLVSAIMQDWTTMLLAGLFIPPVGVVHGTYVLWQMF